MNNKEKPGKSKKQTCKIKVTKNGPYVVSGKLPLGKEIIVVDGNGDPAEWKKGEEYKVEGDYALCRCGKSKTMPYCDGTHVKIDFDGTETAGYKKYAEQSEIITGPGLIMKDAEKLCAIARFCHRAGDAWNLTEGSDDTASKETAIEEACDCPSGRLVAYDKNTGKPIEPEFKPSISLVEDPPQKVSGPLWVKGCVPIESEEGILYEIRNRVTLCRCGKSKNKPFCDGTHITARFTDGDKSLKK